MLKDKVITIVARAAKIDRLELEQDMDGVLWDSLTHLEIVFALEEEFRITLDLSDIAYIRSISKILEVLTRKVA
jgi:acyl carrier protein